MTAPLYLLPNRISESDIGITIPEGTQTVARNTTRFLAENAKSARAYLKALNHPKPIAELEIIEIGHVPDEKQFDAWLQPLLTGVPTAIVSESGCPAIADPGAGIVRRAHELNIRVVPLVGPSSLLMTVMASGLNGQRFRFWGYLPIEEAERNKAIQKLEKESTVGETEFFIETPYRNTKMLTALVKVLKKDTLLTVALDVTGSAESIRTKRVADWARESLELPKLPTVFAVLSVH